MEHFSGSYLHCPLEGDEIRVVWLEPGEGDDQICCELIHMPLNDQQGYFALSYVWGEATDTTDILLNGTPYSITKQLHIALRHLRQQENRRILWIDALCINQQDVDERSQQILRMKDIYENAKNVFIWIGGYAPHTREEVETVFECLKEFFREVSAGDKSRLEKVIRNVDGQCIQHIAQIMHRSWFSRVWVIQESAVCKTPDDYLTGSNQPFIVCGRSSIEFSIFTVAATSILQRKNYYDPEFYVDGSPKMIGCVHEFRRIRNDMMAASTSLRELPNSAVKRQSHLHRNDDIPTIADQLFIYLSMISNGYSATDERDKIYALLGLLTCNNLPASLMPNYAYPANRIFWEYATYLLQETKNLDILSACSCDRSGLPSWVPDWKQGLYTPQCYYGKSGYLRFLENNKKIEVDAMLLSSITLVHKPVLSPINIPYVHVDFTSEDCAELDSASKKGIEDLIFGIYQAREALIEREIEVFGCPALDSGITSIALQQWIANTSSQNRDLDRFANDDVAINTAWRLYRLLMDKSQVSWVEDWLRTFLELASFCVNINLRFRYFTYREESGDYGQPLKLDTEPKPGDILCFLKGASHKFILRPENNEWRLVGTASGWLPVMSNLSLESSTGKEKYEIDKAVEAFWDTNKAKTTRIIIH